MLVRVRAVALNNSDVSMLIHADRRPAARAGRYRAGLRARGADHPDGPAQRTGLGRFFGATIVVTERGKEGTLPRSVT
ncbi:hypothetical protein OG596_37305 [Streptomyces sp. NBC_01102]|uniref:hypothetical protein n=1 Tax=unclassified Streptomyces TaxID=2593676 RepID=UPI00386DF2EA|nr:hypothetical protein OG596_37305 [Streptomyces sp. NBC_01102]